MTPLHHFGEWVRAALAHIPLSGARALFVVFLGALLVWVLALPKSETTREQGRAGENLKIWAAAALAIQIVIYLLL